MIKKYVVYTLISLMFTGCGSNSYEYFNGKDGVDGRDGVDATPVTVVKLCPGVTVYPSKFVEVAFCIGGKLFGTYSQNGGFSTEIPAGTYGSNGINASCNFTVLLNCVIKN